MKPAELTVRWTVGAVSDRGFTALRLSLWGAWRLFGPEADYVVCVNTLPEAEARRRTGFAPPGIRWLVSDGAIPDFLRAHLDAGLAEGVAWKLAPLRLDPARFELSLDNDCILWAMPRALETWLTCPDGRCLLAEDAAACFGQFAALCGPAPRNSGIRGLPPGFDFQSALQSVLALHPVTLTSELDEQGMQVAAVSQAGDPVVVPLADVAICSPFPPHGATLGRCGAHFVGLNMCAPRPQHGCTQESLDAIAAFWDARLMQVTHLAGAPPVRAAA